MFLLYEPLKINSFVSGKYGYNFNFLISNLILGVGNLNNK